MKVAFLTMGKDIGGAKQDVLTLSQKIAAHGHDVFVIAAPGVMDRELTGTPSNSFRQNSMFVDLGDYGKLLVICFESYGKTISNWLTRKAFLRQLLHG